MKKQKFYITELSENPENPRNISDYMLDVLVRSLVSFPKMLELRPIVVDSCGMAIGGNQRLKALKRIFDMDASEINAMLEKSGKMQYSDWWNSFLEDGYVEVLVADDLDDIQKRNFIVKDNTYYGETDKCALSLLIDEDRYKEWCGVEDVRLNEFELPINYDDEDIEIKKINRLMLRSGLKILLTEEEQNFLDEELDSYRRKNGTYLFFLKHLLSYGDKY